MKSVQDRIYAGIRARGRGAAFCTKQVLQYGSRAAVDKALARLADSGRIRRLRRGVYDYPEVHPDFGKLPPSLPKVAKVLARQGRIQASGATIANGLGVSTQVPAKRVYFTDGPTRKVSIGKQTVVFRHRDRLPLPGKRTGDVYQALDYLGKDAAGDPDVVTAMRKALSNADLVSLRKHRSDFKGWMHPIVDRIAP